MSERPLIFTNILFIILVLVFLVKLIVNVFIGNFPIEEIRDYAFWIFVLAFLGDLMYAIYVWVNKQ